jgi:putative hemolysin
MERAPVKAPETALYPLFNTALPQGEIREGRYLARFARTREELDAILRLRFEVFNLELGEGLASSFQTGRDMDEFDLFCHHLIVEDTAENRIIGTYRCQTSDMASSGRGFYSGVEFDMSRLPDDVLADAIELGRACIEASHRNTQALFLLWKGLAMYVAHNRKRYLFGCCSLTSQNPREGWKVMRMLEEGGHLHPSFSAGPQPGYECQSSDEREVQVTIPKLFRTYLRFGARVCGPPAIDRLFKTIDYLVLFDVAEMDAQTRKVFFGA